MMRAFLSSLALVILLAISGCGGAKDGATDVSRDSKAAAPGVPVGGGDDSIQTWGKEASSPERAEATAFVQSYLDARVARDWGRACTKLAGSTRAGLRRLYGAGDCPAAMESAGARVGARTFAEEADVDVLSFRVGGGYGFLIYRRADGVYATALAVEDGAMSVISLSATPIS